MKKHSMFHVPCFMFHVSRFIVPFVLVLLISSVSFADTKVDPLIHAMLIKPNTAVKTMKAFGVKSVNGMVQTDVFVKVKAPHPDPLPQGGEGGSGIQEFIEESGGVVRSKIGDIMTATVPLDIMMDLEASDDVIYIEAAKPMRVKMDYARSITKVDQVQAGTGADYSGSAYTGSGVIVGVVDSGIDCQHADFAGRILSYWDQNISGSGVAEITGSSGKEYTGSELTDGTCTSSPDGSAIGHGTHVTGIAAGANATYKGVAYDASIISVKLAEPSIVGITYNNYLTVLSTNVADSVNYIFRKAQGLKKPAVVNLSIGTSLGAHDGSSLFESSLDGLLIESGSTEKQGRAIINAAGNENAAILADSNIGGIHAAVSVSSSQPKAFEFVTYAGGYDPVGSFGGTWVDIWLDSTSSCTIGVNAFKGSTLKKQMTSISAGESNQTSPEGDGVVSMYVNFSDSSNALNSKQHAIAMVTAANSSTLAQYTFDLVFTGTCTGDAWLYYDNVYYNVFRNAAAIYGSNTELGYQYVNGDSNKTMTIPATAKRVIAVGSFMARDTWTSLAGSQSQTSVTGSTPLNISTFSSLGPTADSRHKPELASPGEPIISTLASNVSVSNSYKGDATHYKQQGSSMSSPHAAGTVAMMFQKNGCLQAADVKNYLTTYADSDSYTGSVPNDTWGYGKLNAAKTVTNVSAVSCTPDNPSENGSSGSCTADSDCPSGKICKDNVCTVKSCTVDSDCASGETCSDGQCVATPSPSSSGGCGSDIGRADNKMSVFVAFLGIFGLLSAIYGTKAYKKARSGKNN